MERKENQMPEETAAKAIEEAVGLHAKFDQLEAGLEEAHRMLDRMIGVSDNQSTPPSEIGMGAVDSQGGAEAGSGRCASILADLNSRLGDLAGRVGRL